MILHECIAVGLVLTLYASEVTGFMAGGLVVPGYIAMILDKPRLLLGTLVVSLITLLILKFLSNFMLLYGRRRLLITVLIGFFFAELSKIIAQSPIGEMALMVRAFGFIIPGLLAYWMDKQGIFPTLSIMTLVGVLIRSIVLILNQGNIVF